MVNLEECSMVVVLLLSSKLFFVGKSEIVLLDCSKMVLVDCSKEVVLDMFLYTVLKW